MQKWLILSLIVLFGCSSIDKNANYNQTNVTFKNKTISLSFNLQEILKAEYINSNKEYSFCLYGTKDIEGNYEISYFYKPFTLIATDKYGYFQNCKEYYENASFLGTIHNHFKKYETGFGGDIVFGPCSASEGDFKLKGIIGIQCGQGDFAFYENPDDAKNKISLTVNMSGERAIGDFKMVLY